MTMRYLVTEIIRGLGQLVFPNACIICDTLETDSCELTFGLCQSCLQEISNDPYTCCSRCAATVGPHSRAESGCADCQKYHPGFSTTVRLGPYSGRLSEAILRIKYWAGEGVAEMLGCVLAHVREASLRAMACHAVIPVPLYWSRRWVRGYNQADAIAREVAQKLNLPLESSCLWRVKAATQHVQPSATARRHNIRDAFVTKNESRIRGKCILLVDDVMTTGSTLSEAARTLRAGGAVDVKAAIVARR